MSKFTYQRSDEIYAISAIIDFAQQKHDRLLCWYASINHIRSWIEIKHRFKKNGLDFMPIYDDMQHKVRDSMRFAVFPFF